MSEEKSQWADLVKWFLNRLPGLLAAFGVGYKFGNRKVASLEVDLSKANLEIEKLNNEKIVNQKFAGKSDADIVLESLRDGGKDPAVPDRE